MTLLALDSDSDRATAAEALIAEARENGRRRRWRRIRVATVIAASITPVAISLGLLAGGSTGSSESRHWPLDRLQTGVLTGDIPACTGGGDVANQPRTVPSLAGLVQVVSGHLWYRRDGTITRLLPASWEHKIVASERIGTNQKFTFRVSPGQYVLVGYTYQPATNAGRNGPLDLRQIAGYAAVSVKAGQILNTGLGACS